ncbi:uncharacterized protein LOC120337504 isoform X1 [Styela clava]
MDSLLETAGNLDQLLDDFEENEEEEPIMTSHSFKTENGKTLDTTVENGSIVTLVDNHLPHKTLELSDVSNIRNYVSESQSSDIQNSNDDSELKNGIPEHVVTKIEQDSVSSTEMPEGENMNQSQPDNKQEQNEKLNMDISNVKDLPPENVPIIDPKSIHVSVPLPISEQGQTSEEFVVVNNEDKSEMIDSDQGINQTNSEILMELFGAAPDIKTPKNPENPDIGTNGMLSPLNPFNIDLLPPNGGLNNDTKAQMQPSGIFSWENMDKLGQNENTLSPVSNGLPISPPGYQGPNPFLLDMYNKTPTGNSLQPELSAFTYDMENNIDPPKQIDNIEPVQIANQAAEPNSKVPIKKTNPLPSQVDTMITGASEIKPLPMDDENYVVVPVIKNRDVALVQTNLEKQEKLSVGFMKEVAVTEEEFEKFLAEMEEEDSRTSINPDRDNTGITSGADASFPIIGTAENLSDMETAVSVVHSDLPTNNSINVPGNTLNSGFSIGENIVGTQFGIDAPPVNAIPVAIPVGGNNATNNGEMIQQGSPTFPLRRKTAQVQGLEPSRMEISESEHHSQNERLHLNIESIEQAPKNGSKYPNTPPPPYTQEMHANYEQAMSPEHLRPPTGHQINQEEQTSMLQESEPQDHSQAAEAENDFSLLPSAILESITRPGDTKPKWVPDHDAPQCSNCAAKFTFTKRRHHCRACGRVYCATCCNERSQLKYLDYKEARVCSMCCLAIKQADALAEMSRKAAAAQAASTATHIQSLEASTTDMAPAEEAVDAARTPSDPLPEVPTNLPIETSQEAEEVTMADQTLQDRPTSIINVPSSNAGEEMEVEGSLSNTPNTKSVRFSDGTRPKHPDEMPTTPPPPSRMNRVRKKHGHHTNDPNAVVGHNLPPIIIAHGENGAFAVQENPDMNVVTDLLESGGTTPQSFAFPNLIINLQFISYANRQCWCFWSKGMDGVGQREVALILEREGLGDRGIPHDAFTFFTCIFDRARKGKMFNTTDFMPVTMLGFDDNDELFGKKENAGFMFVQASSQPLDGLSCLKRKLKHVSGELNNTEDDLAIRSMLFAILVQKTEAPWATLFPMRLMLRLGMETKQYPCPLFSVRQRQPVYHELGHTILGILCDFRNFKYRVVSVPGLRVVATANGNVSVQIPCNRFTDTVKIMNSSNESVLAIGTGTFGPKIRTQDEMGAPCDGPCESHLVCVQDQNTSSYHTEILNMKDIKASNTGAAFVIFNGSLKSDGSNKAKCAIVEDGIMIQLLPEKMEELRASLRSMEDFRLQMGPDAHSSSLTELTNLSELTSQDSPMIEVKWVEDDTAFNIGMFSPIDGTPFEGVVGFNVQGRSEQKGRKHTLRWNQVFFLASTSDPLDMSRLAEQVANGCFLALTPVLHELARHRQNKLAVRVTIHPENVGYVAGSGLKDLPTPCMNALDEHLIQTIHSAANSVPVEQEAVIIELLFSILLSRPGYRTA